MRVLHSDKPLPADWEGLFLSKHKDIKPLYIGYVKPSPRSRLTMPVLLFRNRWHLHRFWKNVLGKGSLGRGCVGAVNSLQVFVAPCIDGEMGTIHMEVDPNFFAIMGLVKGYTSMEVITHESGHAALSYAKRLQGKSEEAKMFDFDEEAICYPLGRIASQINWMLHDNNLY